MVCKVFYAFLVLFVSSTLARPLRAHFIDGGLLQADGCILQHSVTSCARENGKKELKPFVFTVTLPDEREICFHHYPLRLAITKRFTTDLFKISMHFRQL